MDKPLTEWDFWHGKEELLEDVQSAKRLLKTKRICQYCGESYGTIRGCSDTNNHSWIIRDFEIDACIQIDDGGNKE